MNFDLNIDNYSRDELIDMFQLPSNFDKNILEIKETKLKNTIINNNTISKETKTQTINFISKAKNIILNGSNNQSSKNNKLLKTLEEFYNSNFELKPTNLQDTSEYMIQDRPNKPYLSSSPSEFFEGVINPIKKRTVKKILNIDTRFRDNYFSTSSTNFNIILPTNINDVLQMQVNAIEIPTTYYVVSKQYGNNFFSINVNDGTNTSTTVISIPDGNYSLNSIMDTINNQLILAGAPFSYISFNANVTTTTESGTGQTIVGPNGSGNVDNFELNFQADRFGIYDNNTPLPLKFGWTLGFRNGIYTGSLNYVSEGIVDLNGPRYLYLVVDDYNNSVNNNFYGAFNSSIINKNILARISTQSGAFNILEQNNLNIITTPRDYFGPVNLTAMNIQLLDEYGRILDLNNMDFSFCLILVTVYDL